MVAALRWVFGAVLMVAGVSVGDDALPARSDLDASLRKDAERSISLGLSWLAGVQHEDGSWSDSGHPALTAFAVLAFAGDPSRDAESPLPAPARRGLNYLLSCVRDDGVYVEGAGSTLRLYNTAFSLMAICVAGGEEHAPLVESLRDAIVGWQHRGPSAFDGGYGYEDGGDREYADLSTTVIALEAIRTADAFLGVLDRGDDAPPVRDLDWDAALAFVERVQNLPSHNDQPWAQHASPEDVGGFVYHPHESKAGESPTDDGGVQYHSYGSMTYAGLLSFLYADLPREDPRVTAAVDWITRHYTVDENPGMGLQGLYYSYCTMAKALTIAGDATLPGGDGREVHWRSDLVQKLVSLQRIDASTGTGYWVNDEGRWWENDPVLVTGYALFALEVLLTASLPSL